MTKYAKKREPLSPEQIQLRSIKRLNDAIDTEVQILVSIENDLVRITPHYELDRVKGSGAGARDICDAIQKLLDQRKKTNERINQYVDEKEKVIKRINNVENTLYRRILVTRYIVFKRFEDIADELSYDIRTVFRLHKKSIDAYRKAGKDE